MLINTICVCGAGTMGSGIAQVAALSGFRVVLYDMNAAVLSNATHTIHKALDTLVVKGKLGPEEKTATENRIRFTGRPEECVADIIIEAIIEKEEAKIDLFNTLTAFNGPDTIFASNTSSLSVTGIAGRLQHPERVIGMHFFNPAPVMKLVEVVNTSYTSAAVTAVVTELATRMGKTAVVCRDAPGFIVNRVARPYYIESLRLLEEGITTVAQADRLLEATGFKMGPFRLMDLIGHDINYTVSCSVYDQLGKPERLKPSPVQEKNVREGKLGKKTGEGFYKY